MLIPNKLWILLPAVLLLSGLLFGWHRWAVERATTRYAEAQTLAERTQAAEELRALSPFSQHTARRLALLYAESLNFESAEAMQQTVVRQRASGEDWALLAEIQERQNHFSDAARSWKEASVLDARYVPSLERSRILSGEDTASFGDKTVNERVDQIAHFITEKDYVLARYHLRALRLQYPERADLQDLQRELALKSSDPA